MSVVKILILYIIIVNIIAFSLMGIDKLKAKKRAFRIPEATLFLFVIVGGSIGGILGMHLFHHKTRHWYFRYGFPAILILQIILVIVLLNLPIQYHVL